MKIFVPGRICLFGEHSDWAGGYRRTHADIEKGYTLIAGTNQGIYAEVTPDPAELVVTATMPDGERIGPRAISMDKRSLLQEAQEGRGDHRTRTEDAVSHVVPERGKSGSEGGDPGRGVRHAVVCRVEGDEEGAVSDYRSG